MHSVWPGADEPADPTAGMSARERKMYELQQRLRQSRKANENAVIAEKRRQQVGLSLMVADPAVCCAGSSAHSPGILDSTAM